MHLDLDALVDFMSNPKQDMPFAVRSYLLELNGATYHQMRTQWIEWQDLPDHIASKIKPVSDRQPIPSVKKQHDPISHVYHPGTGKYLGSYNHTEIFKSRLNELTRDILK